MTVLSDDNPVFGIGAVARLTGIPLDTLRVWERRYQLVTPQRGADNKRLYSRDDVARLALVKQLVDCGHTISGLANLTESALRERLQIHRNLPRQKVDNTPRRALVCGDALPVLLAQQSAELGGLVIVRSHAAFADFERDVLAEKPDVLIVEAPVLYDERVTELQRLTGTLGPHRLLVVYGFAMADTLQGLRKLGAVTLKAPTSAALVAQACQPNALSPAETEADPPAPRRFDGATLATLANMPSSIRCECPQHLADLLFRLNAFEAYSADCENRNAQDAAVHAHLYRATAKARVLLENALAYLLASEGAALMGVDAPMP